MAAAREIRKQGQAKPAWWRPTQYVNSHARGCHQSWLFVFISMEHMCSHMCSSFPMLRCCPSWMRLWKDQPTTRGISWGHHPLPTRCPPRLRLLAALELGRRRRTAGRGRRARSGGSGMQGPEPRWVQEHPRLHMNQPFLGVIQQVEC